MPRYRRPSIWIPALAGGLALAWYRERERRQSAERLAASTLETLMNAIDANDHVTGQHVRRTASYSLCLAEALGCSESELRRIERIALFHDIGKIHAALFDIVHEHNGLTDEERTLVATHTERGAEVLQPLSAFYPELAAAVLAHHERWDGGGYPHGVAGDRIPFGARVVAIADSFDAITHSRRYHSGEGFERGVAAIREGRGTQFDPHLADVFLSPAVQKGVRRTYEASRRDPLVQPSRAPRADRRSESESSAPEVRFRWRAPSAVSVDPESASDADGSPSG